MAPDRHGSAVITFPNELEVVITREFDAPIALVFDVLTKPEHVSKWGATPPDRMTECSIDLRVGGNYHSSFVTGDGTVFSFSGTYLEVEPPVRTVETWHFNVLAGCRGGRDDGAAGTRRSDDVHLETGVPRQGRTRPHDAVSTASKTASTRWKTSSGHFST